MPVDPQSQAAVGPPSSGRSLTDSDETIVRPLGGDAADARPRSQRDLISDDRPIAEGSLVGPYLVSRLVADGGMGRVYLAKDKVERQVALKVLGPAGCREDSLRLRFEREGDVLEVLRHHPNVVRLLGRGIDAPLGVLWLALEFIDGQDLSTLVRRCTGGRLTPLEAAYVVERCARALACAHSAGVIHRDIKPSNVLVSRDATVKLTDFGVALSRDDSVRLTARDHVMGTLPYMAPEILGDGDWTDMGDMYGLGCLAYKVLAARAPFTQRTFPDLVRAHREEDAPSLRSLVPEVPEPLAELVHALLEKDPARRPTATEVSRRLLGSPGLVPDAELIASEWTAGRAGASSFCRPPTPRPGLAPSPGVARDRRSEATRPSGRARPWDEATKPLGRSASSSDELVSASAPPGGMNSSDSGDWVRPERRPTPAPTPAVPVAAARTPEPAQPAQPARAPREAAASGRARRPSRRLAAVAPTPPVPASRGVPKVVLIALALVAFLIAALLIGPRVLHF